MNNTTSHEYESVKHMMDSTSREIVAEDMKMTSSEAYGKVNTKGNNVDIQDTSTTVYETVHWTIFYKFLVVVFVVYKLYFVTSPDANVA